MMALSQDKKILYYSKNEGKITKYNVVEGKDETEFSSEMLYEENLQF